MASKTVYQLTSDGFYAGSIDIPDPGPLPGSCVEVAPPTIGANQWPHWTGSAWELVADFRGTVGYQPETGKAVIVASIGATLESLGLVATLEQTVPIRAGLARTARREAAKQRQAQRLAARGKDLEALKLLNDL